MASAAGFGVAGLLQGFAQSYRDARIRATEMEVQQRHGLASTLMQLYPNARPEAQADIAQRLLSIYSTPAGKKLDKNIGDISTLGRAATQAGMSANAAPPTSSAMPQPTGGEGSGVLPPGPPSPLPVAGAGPAPNVGAPMAPPPGIAQPIPPPPDLAAKGSGYSPLISPDEKNAQAAKAIASQQDATISAQIGARDRYLTAHPDADPAEVSMALGHTLPMWALNVKVPIKGVMGADLLASNPEIRTQSGQPIDPKSRYDIGVLAGKQFALPTGIGTANIESQIGTRAGALDEKISEFKTTDAYRKWKAQFDASNRMAIAKMHIDATTNKAPGGLIQTAVFAKGGLERLADAESAMDRLQAKGVMGQDWAQNKVEDWVFGKGAVDPSLDAETRKDISIMRAGLGYASSAAMRAHTGRTAREIYDDFKTRLGAGQDWSALRGAMQETTGMLTDYAQSASDENIRRIRSGNNIPTPPKAGPPTGATHIGTSTKDGKDHYLDASGKDLGPVT